MTELTALGNEEPLELVGRDEEDRELNTPEDEMADHALGGDANALRDVVGDVEIGGPDGADYLSHSGRSSIRLYGVPKQGSDGTNDDGEPREVPAERGTDGDRVGDVEASTNHAVENERDGADQAAKDDADNGLAPQGELAS